MPSAFNAEPFDPGISKSIEIDGPDYLRLVVDYDDVNHPHVELQVQALLDCLNVHFVNPPEPPWRPQYKDEALAHMADEGLTEPPAEWDFDNLPD